MVSCSICRAGAAVCVDRACDIQNCEEVVGMDK